MKFISFKKTSAESIVCAILFALVGINSKKKNPENVFDAFDECVKVFKALTKKERGNLPLPKFAAVIFSGTYPNLFYWISDKGLAKNYKRTKTVLFASGFADTFAILDLAKLKEVANMLSHPVNRSEVERFIVEGAEGESLEAITQTDAKNQELTANNEALLTDIATLKKTLKESDALLASKNTEIRKQKAIIDKLTKEVNEGFVIGTIAEEGKKPTEVRINRAMSYPQIKKAVLSLDNEPEDNEG